MSAPDRTVRAGAASPADAEADTGADTAADTARDQRRALLVGLAAVAAVLAVALAVLLFLLSRVSDPGPQQAAALAREEAREDILRAAAQSALNLTSIDNAEFDADVKAVLDGATGAFRADFEARSKDLKQVLTENKVVSEGKVIETALVELAEDGNPDTSTALVVVDSNVKNTAVPEGRVNTYRMKLQLERVDGQWLTSMLEFVG